MQSRVVHLPLIHLDRALKLLDQRLLTRHLLLGDGILLEQRAIPLKINARIGELRLIARAPGAKVEGKVSEVGVGDKGAAMPGMWGNVHPRTKLKFGSGGFLGTLWRGVLLVLLTFVMIALAGRYVRPIATRAGAEPRSEEHTSELQSH